MSRIDVQPLKKRQYKAKENKDPLNRLHVSIHWRTHTLGIIEGTILSSVMEEILDLRRCQLMQKIFHQQNHNDTQLSLTGGAEEKSIKRKLGNLVNLSSSSNVAQETSPKPTESHTASPKLNHHQAPSSSRSIFAKLKAAKQRCMSAAIMFGVSENAMKTIFLQLKPWINVLILKENVSNPPSNLWTFQLHIKMVWFLGPLMLKHAKIQLFIFF